MGRDLLTSLACLAASGLLYACSQTTEGSAEILGAVEVSNFEAGPGAGFGQDDLPDIVLGPPRGGGRTMQSIDTVSLGKGGFIVVRLARPIVDGEGHDFVVFENPFVIEGTDFVFREPGIVSVSDDGREFHEFPCRANEPPYDGCAGVELVFANVDTNDIDPRDRERAGGDAFDLADVGLSRAEYVRIDDARSDVGLGPPTAGFDLDAVVAIHDSP